jgi:hypothetical protein
MLFRHLYFVQFCLVNVIATGLVVAAWFQGWLDGVLATYLFELSGFICLVFLYGLVLCGARIWRHGVELHLVDLGTPNSDSRIGRYLNHAAGAGAAHGESRSIHAGGLRLTLSDRIVGVRHVANSLIFLGLIGTVIGFIIALSGVDAEAASDVKNVQAMVTALIRGMSVAMYTTLVGAVLYIWLTIAHRILVTGTVQLIDAAIELGETRAGA